MSKRSWKDHLLSSGLPLEQSVIQTLKSLGIEYPRDYKYERLNELGVPTIFSVDVHATIMGYIWLEFFIECKYRHDGIRWVFTPDEYSEWLDEDFHETFIVLDQLAEKRIDRQYINRYSSQYSLCGKGIELLRHDANPKSIEQCIHQVKYALVEEAVNALIHQVDNLLGSSNPIFVLVPIIVTTAELWRLHPEATVEDIRQANELHEVAEQKDILVVKQIPDNQLTRHTVSLFDKQLSDEQKSNFDRQNKSAYLGYRHFLSVFSSYYPSLFLVAHYDHLVGVMRGLISMFKDPALTEEKRKEKEPKPHNNSLCDSFARNRCS